MDFPTLGTESIPSVLISMFTILIVIGLQHDCLPASAFWALSEESNDARSKEEHKEESDKDEENDN